LQENYWNKRAILYNNLEWINNGGLLSKIIDVVNPREYQSMLDVGTGTGAVARALSPFVNHIDAVDISREMLHKVQFNDCDNISFIHADILKYDLPKNRYNIATARMVFHHILDARDREKIIHIIYDSLMNDGKLVIIEDVPPNEDCRELYDEIFKLKEDRVSFLPSELVILLQTQFSNVESHQYFMENSSVMNWMKSNDLNVEIQEKIIDLYKNAPKSFVDAYKMKLLESPFDILLRRKFAIIIGVK